MKKILSVALFPLLLVFSGIAKADSPQPPTPPLPQVMPVLTATSCLGDWQANIYNGGIVEEFGNSQSLATSLLNIRMMSGQSNSQDGTVFCSGSIVDVDGSQVDLRFDPRTNFVDVYAYLREPTFLSGGSMYQLQIHLRLFAKPSYGQYFFGTMEGTFYQFSPGPAVPKILFHGNAGLGRGKG